MKEKIIEILKWLEKYTKTDMIYLFKGGFWLSLTTIIISVITFLKMVVFGRFMSQEIYGIYTYIISMSGILAIFSLNGVSTSIVRSIAKKMEGTFILAVKSRIEWGLIGSFISIIISFWYFINQNIILGFLFFITALFIPFLDTLCLSLQYFQAKKKFNKYAKYEILANIFIAFVIIPSVIITDNIIIIIFLLFFSQILQFLDLELSNRTSKPQ